MKITRNQLRRIINEELTNVLAEIGPGVGMAPLTYPGELKHATVDPHNVLAAFSLVDPTMASDLADSVLYALEGDLNSAALVLLFSAGGLGAGAAVVKATKLAKGMEKAGLAAEAAADLADEVVELAGTTSTAGEVRPPTKIPTKPPSSLTKVGDDYVLPARKNHDYGDGESFDWHFGDVDLWEYTRGIGDVDLPGDVEYYLKLKGEGSKELRDRIASIKWLDANSPNSLRKLTNYGSPGSSRP